jgi:thiamine-phosphate pyrophosphorylase|tara:strand:+ start:855 stop:1493 length:639 start_codon:yes stop_codon:yes gene_type:complete
MIPKLHYISQGATPKEHLENIQKACSAGAELVQLCLENISEKKYLKLAKEAREITSYFQTRLIIYNDYKIARAVKADGVHLETADTASMKARIHLYTWQIIGGTANTIQDCKTLINTQVDYITLGPFRAIDTEGKVNTTLGLKGYTAIVEALNTKTPIIGRGSITTKDISEILNTGISGVAVADEITQNFDIVKKFNQLLSASSTEEKRHTF